MIYDEEGNLLAETDSTTGEVMREYAWIDGRPLAAWKDVNTANPIRYAVHVDHLDRPVMMTNTSKTIVWRAVYKPFGEVHSITGPAALDYRFPGQWFMAETGLHYNWHRWYDASLGRYTQPDLFGLFDGPSRYMYAGQSPLMVTDSDGLWWWLGGAIVVGGADLGWQLYQGGGRLECVDISEVLDAALLGSGLGSGLGIAVRALRGAEGLGAVLAALMRDESGGRGKNFLRPDPKAVGPHTVFRRSGTGKITNYETYGSNPYNPSGFQSQKRVDLTGRSHTNSATGQSVATPHVSGPGIRGGVRPALPGEIPL
jgi:RHS repeat-associated protein